MAQLESPLSVVTTVLVEGPLDEAAALAALAVYPVGTVLYECTDDTDQATIYAEWVKKSA